MNGNEETFWTSSTMIAILVAFVTCVMWDALERRSRLHFGDLS